VRTCRFSGDQGTVQRNEAAAAEKTRIVTTRKKKKALSSNPSEFVITKDVMFVHVLRR
jgi:hypothetical protein